MPGPAHHRIMLQVGFIHKNIISPISTFVINDAFVFTASIPAMNQFCMGLFVTHFKQSIEALKAEGICMKFSVTAIVLTRCMLLCVKYFP